MNLNGVTFNEHRLKGLDTHAVKRGGTVEQHGMLVDDFFENVPNLWVATLEHLLGRLDRVDQTMLFELADNERLEEF